MATKKERRDEARAERRAREAALAERERRRRIVRLGAAAVLSALIVVAVLVVISQSGSDSGGDSNLESADLVSRQLQGVEQDGIALGDARAPVTVTEYGDLQCPVCKDFSEQVIPELIDNEVRSGDLRLEFKNFTIIGPQSSIAAMAALAAGQQGRYWNFVELFYRNQGPENSGYVSDDFLRSVAEHAGVGDLDRWAADRDSAELQSELGAVQNEATKRGLNSTPSIVVAGPDGTKTLVAPSLASLRAAISAVASG